MAAEDKLTPSTQWTLDINAHKGIQKAVVHVALAVIDLSAFSYQPVVPGLTRG